MGVALPSLRGQRQLTLGLRPSMQIVPKSPWIWRVKYSRVAGMDKPMKSLPKLDQEAMDRIRKSLQNMTRAMESASLKSAKAAMKLGDMSPQYGPDQDGLR